MAFDRMRERVTTALEGAGSTLMLLARAVAYLPAAAQKSRDILVQSYQCGLGGFWVTMIVGMFSGMILTQQVGLQLVKYGQADQIGGIVGIGMCRYFGPVMTGMILAGLIGSKMAAELGTMKVSEEIDALEVMSISPVKYLVMPRILTMCFVSPVLTAYADLIGILAGGGVATTALDVSSNQFSLSLQSALQFHDLWIGLVNSLFFGITIATVGCSQGLQAKHGAQGVGLVTMRAVVIASVFILVEEFLLESFYGHFNALK